MLRERTEVKQVQVLWRGLFQEWEHCSCCCEKDRKSVWNSMCVKTNQEDMYCCIFCVLAVGTNTVRQGCYMAIAGN